MSNTNELFLDLYTPENQIKHIKVVSIWRGKSPMFSYLRIIEAAGYGNASGACEREKF
jgi:hypothetical protein